MRELWNSRPHYRRMASLYSGAAALAWVVFEYFGKGGLLVLAIVAAVEYLFTVFVLSSSERKS